MNEKLKKTYYPHWIEMEQMVKRAFISSFQLSYKLKMAQLESILIKAYMTALEIGFNDGYKTSLDQLMDLVEKSSFSVEIKETMSQIIEVKKARL